MTAAIWSERELVEAALALGARLPPGAIVWLCGDLGAGKTTFARALIQGLGAERSATSPTYGLVHRYAGRRGPIFHVDCYRLANPEEAQDLDWATITSGDALLIEWPERAGAWAPPPTCTVRLSHVASTEQRQVEVQ